MSSALKKTNMLGGNQIVAPAGLINEQTIGRMPTRRSCILRFFSYGGLTPAIPLLAFLFLCTIETNALAADGADSGTWIGVLDHRGLLLPIGLYKNGTWSNPWPEYGTIPELPASKNDDSEKLHGKAIALKNIPPQSFGGILFPRQCFSWSAYFRRIIPKAIMSSDGQAT